MIWKLKPFRYLWAGAAASEAGGALGTFCNSIMVYELTGSKLALGSMWLLYYLPSLILQLISGPFIDKWSRKWIMVVSQWTRSLFFLLPFVMISTSQLEVWHIYAAQIAVGLVSPFYVPASQALLPSLIKGDSLQSANAVLDGTVRLLSMIIPMTGGVVIERAGTEVSLLLVTIFLLISGSFLLFIAEPEEERTIRKTWLEEFKEGIFYYIRNPLLLWLGIFLAFVQFGVGAAMVLNLPYITDELSESYGSYGLFMAGFPVGYLAGTLLVGKVRINNRRTSILGALMAGGSTYILLAFNASLAAAVAIEAAAGIFMAFFNIQSTVIYQQTVPDYLRGKVFSARLFIIRGAMPLGVLAGTLLGSLWGVRPMFLLIGILIITASAIGLLHPYFAFLNNQTGHQVQRTETE
ncbi:MFS transporter [Bacillus infantis]|uniref:MFS transporter n=1 Tax=Bacillus infantis TaxID=324767 RepID=UPI000B9C33BC|nr:MFS transporter [Bacillus infantis]MCK6207451.1 MFS transporter [Bacillus infantis]OXT16351.1 MFS transporter [Bacillus sp. OG2]